MTCCTGNTVSVRYDVQRIKIVLSYVLLTKRCSVLRGHLPAFSAQRTKDISNLFFTKAKWNSWIFS